MTNTLAGIVFVLIKIYVYKFRHNIIVCIEVSQMQRRMQKEEIIFLYLS